MTVFWYILFGIISGILGGMGMGGGTLLIPLLTMVLKTGQHAAQSANLLAFIPMSAVAVFIHAKNRLIEKKALPPILLAALPAAALGALLALKTSPDKLRIFFGIFLIILGSAYIFKKKPPE